MYRNIDKRPTEAVLAGSMEDSRFQNTSGVYANRFIFHPQCYSVNLKVMLGKVLVCAD